MGRWLERTIVQTRVYGILYRTKVPGFNAALCGYLLWQLATSAKFAFNIGR